MMGVPVSKPEDEGNLNYVEESVIDGAESEFQKTKEALRPPAAKEAVKPPATKGSRKAKKQGGLGHMARWEDMYCRLVRFHEKHGHCLVPNRYAEDPKLGTWVATQRRQYKVLMSGSNESTQLTPQRAMRLQELGFSWSPKESDSWDGFYKEYVDFVGKYGNNKVAKLLGADSPLTKWESAQRQEYALMLKGKPSRLTPSRIQKLSEIGFNWGVKDPSSSIPPPVGAALRPVAKTSMEHHVLKYAGRSGNVGAPTRIPSNPVLQKKRTRELQQRERTQEQELELYAMSLTQPRIDAGLSTGNRLGISTALEDMTSPALFPAEMLQQTRNQIHGLPETSRSSQLFSGSVFARTTSNFPTSKLGSTGPVQSPFHNSLQSPLQNLLENSLQNPLHNTLQNPLHNQLDLQSPVLPSSLDGRTAQALLASLDRKAVADKGELAQGETETTLARGAQTLLSQYLHNDELDNLSLAGGKDLDALRDLCEADLDVDRNPKRRKHSK